MDTEDAESYKTAQFRSNIDDTYSGPPQEQERKQGTFDGVEQGSQPSNKTLQATIYNGVSPFSNVDVLHSNMFLNCPLSTAANLF